MAGSAKVRTGPGICCAFCGKHEDDLEMLVAHHTVAICNDCIGRCVRLAVEGGYPLSVPAKERAG